MEARLSNCAIVEQPAVIRLLVVRRRWHIWNIRFATSAEVCCPREFVCSTTTRVRLPRQPPLKQSGGWNLNFSLSLSLTITLTHTQTHTHTHTHIVITVYLTTISDALDKQCQIFAWLANTESERFWEYVVVSYMRPFSGLERLLTTTNNYNKVSGFPGRDLSSRSAEYEVGLLTSRLGCSTLTLY